jgi:membrane protein DedA with SNARE-associated domain
VLTWLERYSVILLPALTIAEQLGVPLPAVPALLATGALAASGRVNVWLVIGAIVIGTLPVDLVWHELGRRRGAQVLSRLCRLTLEPDICVRRTERLFMRFGVWTLLMAKFLPGLTTVLPPMAGAFGIPRVRFIVFDVAGTVLWAGLWTAVGYVFSEAIEEIIVRVSALGHGAIAVVVAALVAYIGLKYVRRQLFIRRLRIARIAPEDLGRMLEAGEDVAIIDLRTALDVAAVPFAIPGSRWIPAEQLDERVAEIPRDRDLVLYCS